MASKAWRKKGKKVIAQFGPMLMSEADKLKDILKQDYDKRGKDVLVRRTRKERPKILAGHYVRVYV